MAAKEFTTALQLRSNRTTTEKAHNNLGVVRANQGRFEEAVVHFQAALKSNPEYGTAKSNLSLAKENLIRIQRTKTMARE
jgi:Tfp pilus assembly protein PilF